VERGWWRFRFRLKEKSRDGCVVEGWEGIRVKETRAHCALIAFELYVVLFDQPVFYFYFISFHMSACDRFICVSVYARALICNVISRYTFIVAVCCSVCL